MLGFKHPQFSWDAYSYIFEHLSVSDLLKLSLVSKESYILDDPIYWNKLYKLNKLPETDQPKTRQLFLQAYQKKATPLLSEIPFLIQHKKEIYEHFPRNSYKWDALFKTLENCVDQIPQFNANLAEAEDAVDAINERLVKLQHPLLPGVNLTWHYLSRLKAQWLDDIVDQYPQDDTSPTPVKHINFQKCGFDSIPENIGLFQHVETLDLYSTPIKHLPQSLANLPHLTMLLCSDGDFSTLPKVIFECKELKTLSLTHMNISELCDDIAQLKKLEYLYLLDNQLSYLPEQLSQLKHLCYMPIDNNPLKSDQCEAIKQLFNKLAIQFRPIPDDLNELASDLELDKLCEQFSHCYLPGFQTSRVKAEADNPSSCEPSLTKTKPPHR